MAIDLGPLTSIATRQSGLADIWSGRAIEDQASAQSLLKQPITTYLKRASGDPSALADAVLPQMAGFQGAYTQARDAGFAQVPKGNRQSVFMQGADMARRSSISGALNDAFTGANKDAATLAAQMSRLEQSAASGASAAMNVGTKAAGKVAGAEAEKKQNMVNALGGMAELAGKSAMAGWE